MEIKSNIQTKPIATYRQIITNLKTKHKQITRKIKTQTNHKKNQSSRMKRSQLLNTILINMKYIITYNSIRNELNQQRRQLQTIIK